MKEESSFCEQKEAKKLYPFDGGCLNSTAPCHKSFFASFFSKKEDSCLPACPSANGPEERSGPLPPCRGRSVQ
jgi:hypothetical protein